MLTVFQSFVLGLLQGVTELFPVSSLGHTVFLPSLFGWQVDQHDPSFLAFIVLTHLATAIVLLCFFWSDWVSIVRGIFRSLWTRKLDPTDTYARIGWLLVVSTIPAGLLGLLFQKEVEKLFATPLFAALFLVVNGLLLYGAEYLSRRRPVQESHSYERVAALSWTGAIKVGLMQCLALLPGLSRTGATLAGGLGVGFSHQDAARYSFLLATPIIFAAALLKLPPLLYSGELLNVPSFGVGVAASAFGAYVSVRFLSHYFKTKTLIPFAGYCVLAGLVSVLIVR